jgi:transmembrane sensor
MTENRFWNLLAKKLSGEATAEEIGELENFLRANPDLVYSAGIIENLWKLHPETSSYDSELSFELHLNNLKKDGIDLADLQIPSLPFDEHPRPKRKKRLLVSLSVLAALFMAGFMWLYNSKETAPVLHKTYSEVSTRFGSKTKLVLPDSSVVWLNAGSKLTYDENFGLSTRTTVLSGEAYFDVKKSTVPFIINANGLHIKVLGTAFNVKSYPNEKTSETSLVRGKVEITHDKRPGEIFILKPNEKLVIANEEKEENEEKKKPEQRTEPKVLLSSLTHTTDNTVIETSWVENKLIFQDESFEEVAKKMERWYDVRIEIKDEKIARLRLSGTFENENIRQALAALKIAFPFNFTMNENTITITR